MKREIWRNPRAKKEAITQHIGSLTQRTCPIKQTSRFVK
jgi:hypothetical protein